MQCLTFENNGLEFTGETDFDYGTGTQARHPFP